MLGSRNVAAVGFRKAARRNVALVDKDEGLIGDEHLCEFFVLCRADRVLVSWH